MNILRLHYFNMDNSDKIKIKWIIQNPQTKFLKWIENDGDKENIVVRNPSLFNFIDWEVYIKKSKNTP